MRNYPLLSLILLIFAFILDPAAADERSYKIGFISDLSGPVAVWGRQGRVGAELAAGELRKQGIQISIVSGDSMLDPKRGVAEAQKMLFSDLVDAFYVDFTPVVTAVAPVLRNNKKLFIGSAGGKSFLKDNPWAFKAFLDYEQGCADLAAYLKSRGIKNPGLLSVVTEYGELCSRGAKRVFPALTEVTYNRGEGVASQVLVLKQAGVDVVMHTGYEGDAASFMKELAILKWKVPVAGCADDLMADHVAVTYSSALDGALGFGLPEASADFIRKLREFDPSNPMSTIPAAALAYTFIRQLGAALAACPAGDPNCQSKILAASGADPALGFRNWKDRIAGHESALYEWKNGKKQRISSAP